MAETERNSTNHSETSSHLSLSEQAFLKLLLSKGLQVSYEVREFAADLNGRNVTTKPDFFIINPKIPNAKGKYVEITTSPCSPEVAETELDPKQKQRAS